LEPKEGTGILNENGIFIKPEMIENGVKSTMGVDELSKNFHPSYFDIFGDLSSTLKLDVFIILSLSFVFFFGIYIALKRKDSMKIK
jgi:hypothetical protein